MTTKTKPADVRIRTSLTKALPLGRGKPSAWLGCVLAMSGILACGAEPSSTSLEEPAEPACEGKCDGVEAPICRSSEDQNFCASLGGVCASELCVLKSAVTTSACASDADLTAFEREVGIRCLEIEGAWLRVALGFNTWNIGTEAHGMRYDDGWQPLGEGPLTCDGFTNLSNCTQSGNACYFNAPVGGSTFNYCSTQAQTPSCKDSPLQPEEVLRGYQCLFGLDGRISKVRVGYRPNQLPPAVGDRCDSLSDAFACRALGGICGYATPTVGPDVRGECYPPQRISEVDADCNYDLDAPDGDAQFGRFLMNQELGVCVSIIAVDPAGEFEQKGAKVLPAP